MSEYVSLRLRLLFTAVLFVAPACGYDLPTTASEAPGKFSATSGMVARVEGESWNPIFVTVQRFANHLVLQGTSWVGDEAMLLIRLEFKAAASDTPQMIDSASSVLARVVYDPTYEPRQEWIASNTMGSGTVMVTSLSATGATGTFSFIAKAWTPNTVLQDYRVTDGAFYVRF